MRGLLMGDRQMRECVFESQAVSAPEVLVKVCRDQRRARLFSDTTQRGFVGT